MDNRFMLIILLLLNISFAKDLLIKDQVLFETDKRFVSFALDTAQITQGPFWNHKSYQLTWDSDKVIEYSQYLKPFILRVGGSYADDISYFKNQAPTLSTNQWQRLLSFTKKNEAKLFFTLNSTLGSIESYDLNQLKSFLSSIENDIQLIEGFEFGNEPYAFWALKGISHTYKTKSYAENFNKAQKTLKSLYPQFDLAGPASAFWPLLGEPLSSFFGSSFELYPLLKDKLRHYTWHFYPTQSHRCDVAIRRMHETRFLDVKVLDQAHHFAQDHLGYRDKYSPSAKLWLGETGPAQCGGHRGLTDRFLSSLWWLDELGTMAKNKHSVVIRQTLFGLDYGLIRENDFSLTPDFWSSYLWKITMGETVLVNNYSNQGYHLRHYTHCTSKKSPYYQPGSVSILSINIHKLATQKLGFANSLGDKSYQYELSAKKLTSKEMIVNGRELKIEDLAKLPLMARENQSNIIKPLSIQFNVFPEAQFKACM